MAHADTKGEMAIQGADGQGIAEAVKEMDEVC
jgi:hypothetical protein